MDAERSFICFTWEKPSFLCYVAITCAHEDAGGAQAGGSDLVLNHCVCVLCLTVMFTTEDSCSTVWDSLLTLVFTERCLGLYMKKQDTNVNAKTRICEVFALLFYLRFAQYSEANTGYLGSTQCVCSLGRCCLVPTNLRSNLRPNSFARKTKKALKKEYVVLLCISQC